MLDVSYKHDLKSSMVHDHPLHGQLSTQVPGGIICEVGRNGSHHHGLGIAAQRLLACGERH